MTKLRTFLPVYRSERGMTQEELANRVGGAAGDHQPFGKRAVQSFAETRHGYCRCVSLPVESLFFFYDDGSLGK